MKPIENITISEHEVAAESELLLRQTVILFTKVGTSNSLK